MKVLGETFGFNSMSKIGLGSRDFSDSCFFRWEFPRNPESPISKESLPETKKASAKPF
jgi:hypothetical protein